MAKGGTLLLDTHVWIWLLGGVGERLNGDVVEIIEHAAVAGSVHVSIISVWELAMLDAKGRIRIAKDCLAFVTEALAKPGLRLLPLTPDIAVASARLPGSFHGDPADRMLVASARLNNMTLVTKDKRIADYGAQHHVAVLSI